MSSGPRFRPLRQDDDFELKPIAPVHGASTSISGEYVVAIDAKPTRLRHKDGLGRIWNPVESPLPDRPAGYFLNPDDASLVPLHVQDCQKLRSKATWALRLTYWIYKSTVPIKNDNGIVERKGRSGPVWAKYLPGAFAIMPLVIIPRPLGGQIRNNGRYNAIPYREWLCPKSARNPYESDIADDTKRQKDQLNLIERETGPKYLCFLKDSPSVGEKPYECLSVKEYMSRPNSVLAPDFVFISYTRLHFPINPRKTIGDRVLTEIEYADEERQTDANRRLLTSRWGCIAAKHAGVKAFWIDFECLLPDGAAGETESQMTDVYRICDVVRVCRTMAIIRGFPPGSAKRPIDERRWLREWGSRIWTVPEALLCPSDRPIAVYTQHGTKFDVTPQYISKRVLATVSWEEDWSNMGQLLDHYEGSLHLTPLQLVSIALEALMARVTDQSTGKTSESQQREVSHSLMGLLRRRPVVGPAQESGFEAFARLSLANDSDRLLERLLCFQPQSHNAPWYDLKDDWDARLWDVEPRCQVAGIVDRHTITLDGAFGATIQWHDLAQVAFIKRTTIMSVIRLFLIHVAPLWFVFGILLLAPVGFRFDGSPDNYSGYSYQYSASTYTNSVGDAGLALLCVGFLHMLAVPWLLKHQYGGKFWSTQAWFFGMRGIPDDLGLVERYMFGSDHGRLKWSAAGSRLSRHYRNEFGECIAVKPQPASDGASHLQLFTIIDTFTMTATAFYAEKPPSVVLVCGREGGMQRAVLCSYDWKTQTFCREVVIRMKTLVLDRMSRVDRIRVCLTRK